MSALCDELAGSGRALMAATGQIMLSADTVPRRHLCPLVFDGLFHHRPELVESWDVSVLLDADERRDEDWLQYLLADLPAGAVERAATLDRRLGEARWPRDRQGWQRYVAADDPRRRATVVIDNNDLARPSQTCDRPGGRPEVPDRPGPPV